LRKESKTFNTFTQFCTYNNSCTSSCNIVGTIEEDWGGVTTIASIGFHTFDATADKAVWVDDIKVYNGSIDDDLSYDIYCLAYKSPKN